MSWLAALLERNSGDPRARLDLGTEILERLRSVRLPPDSGLLNDFCDLCVQWISASNYKVALMAFDLLEVAVQESGEVVATFVLDRAPAIVERLGDSKSSVRDASASLLTRLAYAPRSSPQILLDKLAPGFTHRQWLVRTGSMGVFCGILEECRDAVEGHTMRLVPTFSKLLADPNAEVREAAAKTLACVIAVIGPSAEAACRTKGLIPEAKLNLLAARARELAIRSISNSLNNYNGDRHSPCTPGSSRTTSISSRASPYSMFKAPHPPNGRSSAGSHDDQENRKAAVMSAVPRSNSGTIRRVGASPAPSGTVGAVNEDEFRKNFNAAGVKISIFDARTLTTEMAKARDCMADEKQDWNRRTAALKMMRAIYQNGGRDFDDVYLQEVLLSEEALLISVKDLRSQVCKEACLTVSYLSEEFGVALLRIAEALMPHLIALIQNSAKVMSTSGILAATFIVRNIQHPKLIPIILAGLSSKSKEIRRETQSLTSYVLEWEAKKVERNLPQIVDAIKAGLGDADPGARTNARVAYAKLEAAFPRSAEMLYKSLDPSKQRSLAGGTASQSSSTQSIVSEKDTMAFNHRPGTFGLQKQKAYFGGRSTSEIDPAAARRAGLTPPRRVLPGGVAGAMRKMTTPLGVSRMGLPPSGGSGNSRMMRSTTPSGMAGGSPGSNGGGSGAGSASQPGSRSTSPSAAAHSRFPNNATPRAGTMGRAAGMAMSPRKANGTTSRDASPLRRGAHGRGADVLDGPRKYSLDFDDSMLMTTPTRSTSLGTAAASSASPRSVESATVMDALRAASSSAPNERKEGLATLKACILGPSQLDSHNVIKIRDMLTKMLADGTTKQLLAPALDLLECFVAEYHAEMADWLPSLLPKLIQKQANEILPMMQSHLARTLAVVRSSFAAQRQLEAICRAIKNPVSIFNTKVRGAILAYVHELTTSADGQLALAACDDIRLAVSKVISWASDPKCAPLVGQCEQLVVDLFHANEAEFSSLVDALPPGEREYARRLCRSRSNSVRDDINQVTAQINDFVLSSQRSASTAASPAAYRTHQAQSTVTSPTTGGGGVLSPLARQPAPGAVTASNQQRHIAVIKPSTKQATVAAPPPRDSTGTASDLTADLKQYGSMTLHLKDDPHAQQEFISKSREDICNSSRPVDQIRALQALHAMISEGSFTLWDANFKPLLLAVFGVLGDATVCEDAMRLALKLMTKLCLAQAARLNTYADSCVLKVLDVGTNGDWGTQVTVAAEECARTLATHLPPQVVIRVLNPIVEAEAEGARKALALKMLPTLCEHLDADELTAYLPDVVPGVVKAYDVGRESNVRKAAVFALVALHNKLGHTALEPYVSVLQPARLRLMEVYIGRSQTASNHF